MSNSSFQSHHFGVFFQARKEGHGTVSMFGVLHFGNDSMYPLPQSLEQTFQQADQVAFETNLENLGSTDFRETMEQRGTLQEDGSLEQMISPQTWTDLRQVAAQLGLSEHYLRQLQPWYCSVLMTSAAMRQTGLDSCLGIDATLFQKASECHKNVICLESPEQQLNILAVMRRTNPEAILRQALEEVRDMRGFSQNMLHCWFHNEQDNLAKLLDQGFADNPDLKKRLLQQRNQDWYDTLAQKTGQQNSLLAVVGAGHLVGPNSLPETFRHHGYALLDLNATC